MPAVHHLRSCGLTAVAVSLIVGCGVAEPPDGDVVLRWIRDDPEEVIAASDILSSRLDGEIGPTTEAASRRWRGHDVRIDGFSAGALDFEQDGEDPWLATRVDLDADTILAVEVELTGPGPGEAQLFWAGRWQRFSTRRMERATEGRHADTGTIVYRFEVGDNPDWWGRVTDLRIDVPPGAAGPMRLGAVRIVGWLPDPAKLAAASDRPWKVDLGRSARNSLLAPPGASWDAELTVPDGAVFSCSYGLQPAIQHAVTFKVVVETDGSSTVLFDDRVTAGGSRAGEWHEATVDLASLAGSTINLRLVTEAGPDATSARGFPVWANPEILAPRPVNDRPNVVVVLLDTLRADRLSVYGHPLETSPRMDRWAAEKAVRFANVVAPAPWTLPSHASLFTGLDALRHGFNFWGTAPTSLDMIAEVLRRNGYTTAAITGGGLLHPEFGFAQGFDLFDYWHDPNSEDEVAWVFDRARRVIEDHRQRRFFLFVHTYEMHAPHRRRAPHFDRLADAAGITPADFELDLVTRPWEHLVAPGDVFVVDRPGGEGWTRELSENELATVGLMYDSAVSTVDDEVGRLLDHLTTLGLRGRTIVVVTSDHGEALGEDGRAGHAYLDDYNLLVPLMLELPDGLGAGEVVDTQVRLVDLMPTVLEAAGIDPPEGLDGRSLLDLAAGADVGFPHNAWAYAASSNQGLAMRVDNRLKYRFPDPAWAEIAHREALYDLENDPDESVNLAPGDPRLVELRSITSETILAQHRGVRLVIRNRGEDPLRGRLNGAWAAHDRVKTSDHGSDRVHWKAGSAAVFDLESGAETTLLFTQLTDSVVGLEIEAGGSGHTDSDVQSVTFDLEAVRTPAAFHLTPSGWRLDEDFTGTVETGFLLQRVGELHPIVTDGLPAEAETLDRLRALGYVE